MGETRQSSGEPIRTISAGQGAVVADRANASQVADAARRNRRRRQTTPARPRREPEFQTDRRLFIGLAVAALAVVAIIALLASRAVRSVLDTDAGTEGERVERAELDLSGAGESSLEYDGYLYSVQDVGGSSALVRTSPEGGEPLVLAELPGSPVSLVLYNGAFIIGENAAGGWDVVAYTMSDGSVASALIGADGEPVAGEGLLVSMGLEGDELVLSFEDDQSLRVPLR